MKVVRYLKDVKLVEFEDEGVLCRAWIPTGVKLTKKEARRGIAYGVTLLDVEGLVVKLDVTTFAKQLLNSLHQRDIWTGADLNKPQAASAIRVALFEAFGIRPIDVISLLLEK